MIAFIQSRMSSKRLPKKSLMTIAGKPMLYWVNRQVNLSSLVSHSIVITSTDEDDDEIESFCAQESISCIRGSLKNVHSRFLKALLKTKVPNCIRITGDSPLIDPALIDHAVSLYKEAEVDVVTNTFPRSFPKGQSVEVINTRALLQLDQFDLTSEEKEHVTLGIYNRNVEFRIKNFETPGNYSSVQLSVDSYTDLESVRDTFETLGSKNLSWRKAADMLILKEKEIADNKPE